MWGNEAAIYIPVLFTNGMSDILLFDGAKRGSSFGDRGFIIDALTIMVSYNIQRLFKHFSKTSQHLSQISEKKSEVHNQQQTLYLFLCG